MIEQEAPMQYVWDPFVRVFHWSLVVAFAVAFYTHASEWDRLIHVSAGYVAGGLLLARIIWGLMKTGYASFLIHVSAGYVAGGLLLARIIWGLMKTGYASFDSFPLDPIQATKHICYVLKGNAKRYVGHNPAGSLVIYAMLVTGLTAVGSGWLVYNEGWLIDQPEFFQTLHQYSTWGWLILVFMHVTGVLAESVVHKDNLILAMITGCKRVTRKDEKQARQKIS